MCPGRGKRSGDLVDVCATVGRCKNLTFSFGHGANAFAEGAGGKPRVDYALPAGNAMPIEAEFLVPGDAI